MKFYTSVIPHRGRLLVRAIVNGKRIQKRINYKPSLFVPNQPLSWAKIPCFNSYNPIKFLAVLPSKALILLGKNRIKALITYINTLCINLFK